MESWKDSLIDNTLTTTGKAADAKKVGDELADLKGDLSDLMATVDYPVELVFEHLSGYYIITNNDSVDVASPYTSGSYTGKSVFLECEYGDRFIINAYSGSFRSYAPWFFCDEYGNILLKSDKPTYVDFNVVAPESSAYIGITTDNQNDVCYRGQVMADSVKELVKKLNNINIETDTTLSQIGKPADSKTVGDKINIVENRISTMSIGIINSGSLSEYLYKTNTYINNSGDEIDIDGYDTYKIPCSENQIVHVSWSGLSEEPWAGIEAGYAVKVFKNDSSFIRVTKQSSLYGYISAANKEMIMVPPTDAVYITLTIKSTNVSEMKISIDIPGATVEASDKIDRVSVAQIIDEKIAIKTQFYNMSSGFIGVLGASIKSLWFHVNENDKFVFSTIRTGLSMRATFRDNAGNITNIGTIIASPFEYTCTSNGIINVFYLANENGDTIYNPNNQIKIDAKNVIGLSSGTQFSNLQGVAFGTSLTYYASVTNGYLTRLAYLSGITFDNQGVGSSTILGDGGSLDMLAKIKSYSGFSDKRVCILEGFVNDWYGEKTLGSWADTSENTVCGCVRSAINYILTQNQNITLFMILDHYGKQHNTLDCSSTIKKNNLTQWEYYEEIKKVAESLGIPVIREYALSGISELMPQYLDDNIHLNALGAIHSANVIWREMQLQPLNAG